MTSQQLAAATGATLEHATKFLPYIVAAMAAFEINTPARQLAFLAQVGHESGGLFYTEEIASGKAYEGRKDLGNTLPGDGVKFKGRGLIQITGRTNYFALSGYFYTDFLKFPELLSGKNVNQCTDEQLRNAAMSAGWYWSRSQLNKLADTMDVSKPLEDKTPNMVAFIAITKKINGGTNGLRDRIDRWRTGREAWR